MSARYDLVIVVYTWRFVTILGSISWSTEFCVRAAQTDWSNTNWGVYDTSKSHNF